MKRKNRTKPGRGYNNLATPRTNRRAAYATDAIGGPSFGGPSFGGDDKYEYYRALRAREAVVAAVNLDGGSLKGLCAVKDEKTAAKLIMDILMRDSAPPNTDIIGKAVMDLVCYCDKVYTAYRNGFSAASAHQEGSMPARKILSLTERVCGGNRGVLRLVERTLTNRGGRSHEDIVDAQRQLETAVDKAMGRLWGGERDRAMGELACGCC